MKKSYGSIFDVALTEQKETSLTSYDVILTENYDIIKKVFSSEIILKK